MYNKNIALLHLLCLLGAIGIYYVSSIFIQTNSVFTFSSVIIFHLACYQITEIFSLSKRIIKNGVEQDFEKHREKYKKEFEQAKRQSEFFEAFETTEEKEVKENNINELDEYRHNYEQAKITYLNKKVSEMDSFEKANYYERRLIVYRKVMQVFTVLTLLLVGLITMLGSYFELTQIIAILSIMLIIYLIIWLFEERLRKKYIHYYNDIKPKIFKKFLKDMGIE